MIRVRQCTITNRQENYSDRISRAAGTLTANIEADVDGNGIAILQRSMREGADVGAEIALAPDVLRSERARIRGEVLRSLHENRKTLPEASPGERVFAALLNALSQGSEETWLVAEDAALECGPIAHDYFKKMRSNPRGR